jgi:hypothetical protein
MSKSPTNQPNMSTNNRKTKVRNSKNSRDRRVVPYARYTDPRPITVSSELKLVMTNSILTTNNVSGTIFPLTFPSQGLTFSQRIADRCHIQKIEIQGVVYNNTAVEDQYRLVVVQAKGSLPTALPPVYADLFQQVNALDKCHAPFQYNVRSQFHVLCDFLWSMSDQGDNRVRTVREACSPNIKDLRFTPTTIQVYNGQIYIFAMSLNGGVIQELSFALWYEDGN